LEFLVEDEIIIEFAMNKFSILLLKCLRHGYKRLFPNSNTKRFPVLGFEESNDLIYNMLCRDNPCMIARYGATELVCILNYLSIKKNDSNLWRYIKGENGDWWWNPKIQHHMEWSSGFFPTTEENLSRFSEMMLRDSHLMDILAVFSNTDRDAVALKPYLKDDLLCVPLISFDSFLSKTPWTRCLKGRKVLVVHPYAKLIEKQYVKRMKLFADVDVLPEFDLRTIEAVQSLGGVNHGFKDWFEALEWMKKEMDKEPYEIVLIGCGAYGFPLAAHAKKTGHKAVHIGGPLQLLFGIKGSRWEKAYYAKTFGLQDDTYLKIMDNSNWVRPSDYRTKEVEQMENSAYL
jgi:hypothetical protein